MAIRKLRVINRILVLSFILFFILLCGFDIHVISGTSMSPQLTEGDIIISSPWVFGVPHLIHSGYFFIWKGVRKGDILVYNNPIEGKISVKQCMAVTGDYIEFNDEQFFINGIPLPRGPEAPVSSFQDGTLSNSTFFCMGSNEAFSLDSRLYGPIPYDYLIGKVLLPLPWK